MQELLHLVSAAKVGEADAHHLAHRAPPEAVLVAEDVAHEADHQLPRSTALPDRRQVLRRQRLPDAAVHRVVQQVLQKPACCAVVCVVRACRVCGKS